MALSEKFDYVDPEKLQKEGSFGSHFMRRLSEDLSFGNDPATMGALLERYAKRDEDGNIQWEETGKALVKSLNVVLSDKATRDDEGKLHVEKIDLPQSAQDAIIDLFKDHEGASIQKMARVLQQNNLQLDKAQPGKEESMATFLYRMAAEQNSTFDFKGMRQLIAILGMALDKLEPGPPPLGTIVTSFFNGREGEDPDTPGAVIKDSFSEGFNLLYNGGEKALAEFHDIDPETAIKNWAPPANPSAREQFFSDDGYSKGSQTDREGRFNLGGKEFETLNFENVLLARWEEMGLVKFDTEEARENAIWHANTVINGDRIDDQLLDRLEYREIRETFEPVGGAGDLRVRTRSEGILQFHSPAAKQAFIQELQGYNTAAYTEHEMADKVIDFVGMRGDISFARYGEGGVQLSSFEDVLSMDDENFDRQDYKYFRFKLAEQLQHYKPAATVHEASERYMEYLKYAEDTTLNMELMKTKGYARQNLPATSLSEEADSASASADNTVSYRAEPTGSGKPSFVENEHGYHVHINENIVGDQFGVYARGENAVAVTPGHDMGRAHEFDAEVAMNDDSPTLRVS